MLSWQAIAAVQRGQEQVIVGVVDGAPVGIRLFAIGDRAGLLRSVERQQPQKPPVLRYAVAGGVALVVAAVAVWQLVLPEFVVQDEETLPATTAELGRACEGAGTRFTSAPAYGGESPHPIMLFAREEGDSAESYERVVTGNAAREWLPQSPDEVQLVGCAERTGPGRYSQNCAYQDLTGRARITSVGLYQGVYTVDIYELRTHEHLGAFEVTGDLLTCPSTISDEDDDIYATASVTAYQSVLRDLVYRPGA